MKFKYTIISQSTPIGNGGIGIIRISGKKSYKIAKIILKKKKIKNRYAYFCKFKNKKNKIIDHIILIYYKKPKSFTGENTLEIQCHGGQKIIEYIINQILKLKIKKLRISKPGEFTKRAFLNNKINLIQAESINNLINAKSENEINSSILSLEGILTKKIKKNIKNINKINIEILKYINFTEKKITNKKYKILYKKIKKIYNKIKKLLKKIKKNKIIKEGIKIIVIGKPNTGKSSLTNYLTKKNNSIITNIKGTTRDLIKEYIYIKNICIEIIDTAGIRKTKNKIEKIGIKKTIKEIKKSKIIIYIFNHKEKYKNIIKKSNKLKKKIKNNQKLIIVRNKIDLIKKKKKKKNIINISIKKKKKLNILLNNIIKNIKKINNNENKFYTNKRHYYLIKKTSNNIKYIIKYIKNKKKLIIDLNIINNKLYKSQINLNNIIGNKKITQNKIINKIFKDFCIGK